MVVAYAYKTIFEHIKSKYIKLMKGNHKCKRL